MNAFEQVCGQQVAWTELTQKPRGGLGYFQRFEDNLLLGRLSPKAQQAFEKGRGSETEPSADGTPAKMCAPHSSSALVVNFFDYWSERDPSVVAAALRIDKIPLDVRFEEQLATGAPGSKAHLDLFLTFSEAAVIGVESKFTEWMQATKTKQFKPAYFPEDKKRWKDAGLPRSQALAEAIQNGAQSFSHLDAAQLLKHMLALSLGCRGRCTLYYLYYDCSCPEGDKHRDEVQRFAKLVEGDMPFRAETYQSVFRRLEGLCADRAEHQSYVDYLRTRYFPGKSSASRS